MTIESTSSKSKVLLAAATLVILGGVLGVRLIAQSASPTGVLKPAPAAVPDPASLEVASLEIPCWSCPNSASWPVSFQTDLDLLAPLGEGSENAATWFKDFTKPDGPRFREAVAMMERAVDIGGMYGKVLPGDDPLLLEAEPWCDQATMHFFPAFFELEGLDTRIPNLLLPLSMARSWVARGVRAEDAEEGLEDCRRAIRLGRLLRQDDVTIISDLVGLVCIGSGTRGIYEIARRTGDLELALIASVVVGEIAPQRLMTSERVSRFDLGPYLHRVDGGGFELNLPDDLLDAALEDLADIGGRRFFGEAVVMANVVRSLGTGAQQNRATAFLEGLVSSEDPVLAEMARWALANPPSESSIAEGLRRFVKARPRPTPST